jgi:two-component sensor histidine kinase
MNFVRSLLSLQANTTMDQNLSNHLREASSRVTVMRRAGTLGELLSTAGLAVARARQGF